MRAISLFAGGGGFGLGTQMAGVDVIWAVDRLAEARLTHAAALPDVHFVESDIRHVTRFPSADLVIGGYPCQPFSLGGRRKPGDDVRTRLYLEFARAVEQVRPKFFVAENVRGLQALGAQMWLDEQLDALCKLGYVVSYALIRAERYGVAQRRRRLFIVGVRDDLAAFYRFPPEAPADSHNVAHGDLLKGMPLWPHGEFYERPHDPKSEWSWYYMSRNRKAPWDGPAFTVLANARHVSVHPAAPAMELVWSETANRSRQQWRFTERYEHLSADPTRPALERPRRLSWRECARIQTFPSDYEPRGTMMRRYELVGNAVPPRLAEAIIRPLRTGSGLVQLPHDPPEHSGRRPAQRVLLARSGT